MTRTAAGLALAVALLAAACTRAPRPSGGARGAETEEQRAIRFAGELSQAFAARDERRVAALCAPDAVAQLVGDAREARGRAAIERALGGLFREVTEPQLTIGRTWVSATATVFEMVLSGLRAGRRFGAVGAVVVSFDRAGLARTQRIYLDVVTLVGQSDPAALPSGMEVRPFTRSPPAGTALAASSGTAEEAHNLDVSRAIWGALEAHKADTALLPMAEDYVYVDFAAPRPLSKAETEVMVGEFLDAVPDFAIAEKPVHFAAGQDVVTEMVERGTLGGKPIVLHGLDVRRFVDGVVVQEWQYSNYVEVLRRTRGVELVWP